MIDELIEAARLCEEQGFRGPASALRVASDPVLKAFVVLERVPVPHPWLPAPKQVLPFDGVPHALFLRPDPAARLVTVQNARMLRHRNLLNYTPGYGSFADYCPTRSVPEFEVEVCQILGKPFWLNIEAVGDFNRVHDLPPMFPADATDEQMEQIANLFTFSFFFVEEIEFKR